MPARKDRIEMLPLAALGDNPFQIGFPPDEAEVARAAYLVRDHGLAIPLVARARGKVWQLGTGRTWLAACRLLGAARVPVLLKDLSDAEMAALAFEEAVQAGQIGPAHAGALQAAVRDPWVADVLGKLRRGEAGYRVEADPEAARNLPILQRFVAVQASAEPSLVPQDRPAPAPAGPVAAPVPAAPRGIHDTLLGVRLRHVPPMWFQTVSEPGKRWVLESMNSAGQIEVAAPPFGAASFEEAMVELRLLLAPRMEGADLPEGRVGVRGTARFIEIDMAPEGQDLHQRVVLLWREGRGVLLQLTNNRRFFLYDVKAFEGTVEAAELL